MSIESGRVYRLLNGLSPKSCMEICESDNNFVYGYPVRDDRPQKWMLQHEEGSHWTVKSVETSGYLGISGTVGYGSYTQVVPEPFVWDIWPDEGDPSKYRFFVPGTKFCFDLSDYGNPNPKTRIIIWHKHHGQNQTWELSKLN